MHSWHGAQLKQHRDNYTFTFLLKVQTFESATKVQHTTEFQETTQRLMTQCLRGLGVIAIRWISNELHLLFCLML